MNTIRHLLLLAFLLFILSGPRLLSATESSLTNVPSLDELAGNWQIASNLLSLPALNNSLGSGKCAHDALAIGDLSFPPITMTGDTGSLLVDGQTPTLNQTRWFAYQVLRQSTAGNLGIATTVRMPYHERGLLYHIVVTNNGMASQTFQLQIVLSAATSRHDHWAWSIPRDTNAAARFSITPGHSRQTLLLNDPSSQLANCFAFAQKPDELSFQGDYQAVWNLTLKPGESTTINYALAIGDNTKTVSRLATKWAKHFDAAFNQVPVDWQTRYDAMFNPGNKYFSGSLPVLVTPDGKISRIYYMSVLSLLNVMRTGFPVEPRVYISNTPEDNCTMMYFWDTREWATVFALLDPVVMKNCLRSWLKRGIYNGYAEESLTGTLQGPWYSANDYSVFILLNNYLNVTGDRDFLSEKIGNQTVLQHMDSIATHWQSLVQPGQILADYGGASNLLECVPTYIHEVASFNAANVWMMRRVAEIQAAEGNQARADELRTSADKLLPAVLSLYVPGQGVWDALYPDGKRVQIRHVFDFATIGLTIPNELTPKTRGEMTDFVERELLTDHWMRAQSLSDLAAPDSDRPDHGPMGAFCAWPAETAETFCEFGEYDKALDVFYRCVGVTYEGPFSQSHELCGRTPDAPAHITSRGDQTWNASNGGSFAETVIREFFGYQPDFLQETSMPLDAHSHGFRGELENVREGNRVFDIVSDENGIKAVPPVGR